MNHDEESKNLSALDIFSQCQETLDEAKKKNQSESSSRAQYLRLSKDGTYNIRILPLAPVINAEGKVLPLTRKGYEYPSKEYLLKINTGKADKKGKDIFQFVSICNARLAFPELENDLLDLYVSTACELYSNDKKKEEMCKKLKESSFNGGLKYDSKRCLYVLDLDKRNDGMQILQLSFAQYKELENRKLKLWQRLAKRGAVPCPISSPLNAFPVEIERKNDNGKTSYQFEIITQEDEDQLSENELQALLDAPRLPDILYKYTRYHLEATIAFLKQVDDQYGINIMSEPAIADCIDQIKMKLPSDDQSHFSIKGNEKEGDDASTVTLGDLFKIYDQLEDAGKSDRSEEGADLRGQIRQFIEDNDLDIKISRTKTNLDVLQEIEDVLGNSNETEESDDEEEAPAPARRKSAPVADEEDEDDGAPASDPSDADDDEEDEEEESPRHTRNDDTNEPAARPRRTLRPARRR